MVRIVSSPLALRIAVALDQAPAGRRTSELAQSLAAPFTSIERALDVLEADAIVATRSHLHSLVGSQQAGATVRMAVAFLDPMQLLAAVSRTNRSVEYCGHDDDGFVMVTRRFADLADEAALAGFLVLLLEVRDIRVETMDKGTLRDRLAVDDALRSRALRMTILAGSVDRSFPDRTRHGDPSAPSLGRLHPSLPMPSQRRLRALARRYQLRQISAFGSATRTDFRSDSDVDLLVEPRVNHSPRIGEMARLSSEVEDLFGRDVDLLAGPVGGDLRTRIDRDAVVLYESGR